jgi:hypothetical protein
MLDARWTTRSLVAGLALLALATAACSGTRMFAVASVGPQDGTFFAASPTLLPFQPIPKATLTFELKEDSLLTFTFSAEGFVVPLSPPTVPIPSLFIQCQMDGKPCAPGINESATQFLFPQATRVDCCDSRAYTWVNQRVAKGTHTVTILGRFHQQGGSQAETVTIADWSLVVQAYAP